MKINIDALKTLELKLAEYSKANGTISEHKSAHSNCGGCTGTCVDTCYARCSGSSKACYGY